MTSAKIRPARALAGNRKGATLVEFAIVAPVLGLMLIGAFDVGHTLYMRTVLQGILQKTARDSGLEVGLGKAADIDKKVTQQVKALANNADIKFSRRFYRTFSNAAAAKAEEYTDLNDNNKCDDGEPFEDENSNGVRDADGGDEGQGGAKDAVLYTVKVNYPRMFPLHGMIGLSNTSEVEGSMILANQPFGDQGSYGARSVGHCT